MSLLRIERRDEGRVLAATLVAPKGNVIDTAMVAELQQVVDQVCADPTIAVLLLAADGEHFSYGASVPEHVREKAPVLLGAFHRLLKGLTELPAVSVAAVQGMCLGGGFELVAACDLLLLDEGAKLGVPEITLGVYPPAAAALLPLRIGSPRAAELLLTGRKLAANDALAWGLANHVFPRGMLPTAVGTFLATNLLPQSTSTLRLAAPAARRSWAGQFASCLDALERAYLGELMETADANEGIAAFLEKRKPRWSHGKKR